MVALICPVCKHHISAADEEETDFLNCSNDLSHVFPIREEIPILINDRNSVFAIDDYLELNLDNDNISQGMYNSAARRSRLGWTRKLYRKVGSYLTEFHVKTGRISATDAVRLVETEIEHPEILVIGAGENRFQVQGDHAIVYTDVAISPGIGYVCDAHDLPFADGNFDLVIAEAVLEHVADPPAVVNEIHRVLREKGIVYASAPFLQPVHMGAYDFTRWTCTGYRRLFRDFDEIALEPVLGPGSSLAYAVQYFFTSFSGNRRRRSLLNLLGLLLSRPLKYFDKILLKRRSALGFAAGYGFIGRKASRPISDRDLVKAYSERLKF